MTLKHFIERPVLASVVSIVIVIAGIIGLATLPVEQYPDIAPPTVMVRASYPGASAETIQKSVIAPLEQAINGVEDMTYMTSSAAVGSASVTIYFRQGINADMAAVNVQNKVSRATGQLPSEVTQIGVTTMKRQTSMVKIFSLYSPDDSYDETFLSNYSKINIEPRIQRIHGVGEVFTLGADYSMRVWLKPDVMAQYKLIPSDVTAALAEQNIEDTFTIPTEIATDQGSFILEVHGSSMINVGIFNGDYIIVREQKSAMNGEIVVAMIDGSATVKTFYKEQGRVRLQPENDTMEPIYATNPVILGKVVGLMRRFS